MRIFSTKDSIANKEVTVAAIFETILASAISLVVAIKYDTMMHIAVGACLAPVLLMRSPSSVKKGLEWFWTIIAKIKTEQIIHLQILITSIVVRLLSPLYYPLEGIKNIPENWVRVVFQEDIRTDAEMVPGWGSPIIKITRVDYLKDTKYIFFNLFTWICFAVWHHTLDRTYTLFDNIVFIIGIVSAITAFIVILVSPISLYIASYLYRLSVKSTFYIWLPLIYLVKVSFDEKISLKANLEIMQKSASSQLARAISWLTIALFAWKVLFLPSIISWWNAQYLSKFINIYLAPNEIPLWQLASAFNAALNICGHYYFFDKAPILINEGQLNENITKKILQIFKFTRGFISLYTIGVMLLLTVFSAQLLHLPSFSFRLLPSLP